MSPAKQPPPFSDRPIPGDVQYRMAHRFQPGWWWEGEYPVLDYDGNPTDRSERLWAEVSMVLHMDPLPGTGGQKYVRILGTDTTGEPVEARVPRGHEFRTVTARQAAKAGLRHLPPEEVTTDTPDDPDPV